MAEKNSITRVDALDFALDLIREFVDNPTECAEYEKLKGMRDSLAKPRAKKEGESAPRIKNKNLANEVHAAMVEKGDGLNARDIVDLGIVGITSTQKASAVMKVGVEEGLFKRGMVGKTPTYYLA